MAKCDGAIGGPAKRWLRVSPMRGTGGRVSGVANSNVALQRLEGCLIENLGDQAHVFVNQNLFAGRGCYAG